MEQLGAIFRIPTFRALLLLGEVRTHCAVTDELFDCRRSVAVARVCVRVSYTVDTRCLRLGGLVGNLTANGAADKQSQVALEQTDVPILPSPAKAASLGMR